MKKTIKLTESDLTALVRRILNEVAEEPVLDHAEHVSTILFFDEGKTFPSYDAFGNGFDKEDYAGIIEDVADYISKETNTIKALEKFYDNQGTKIPKFISLNVGTSHSGTGEKNSSVAQGRLDFLMGIVMKAFDRLGLDSSVAKSFVISNTNAQYKPTKLNKIYDPKKVKVNKFDRFAYIGITPMNIKGNTTSGIQHIQRGLNNASSLVNTIFVDNVNETKVVFYIKRLGTFSDIQDLSKSINAGGNWNSLEDFLNDQLFDDQDEMTEIAKHLQKLAISAGKQKDTVRLFSAAGGLKISIGLGN